MPPEQYRLEMGVDGALVFATREGSRYPPKRVESAKATVHYDRRGVPMRVCYDECGNDHPDDKAFCAKEREQR